MTRLIILSMSLLLPHANGELQWESKSIESTAQPGQTSVNIDFSYKNSGTKVVVIDKVDTSCSCTKAKPTKTKVGPGESGLIQVEFVFGTRVGIQRKHIDVLTSDAKKETLLFTVGIPELYRLSTRRLDWKRGDEGVAPQVCQLKNLSATPIKIKSVSSTANGFSAEIKEVKAGMEYDLVITPNDLSAPTRAIITVSTEPIPGNDPITYAIFASIH